MGLFHLPNPTSIKTKYKYVHRNVHILHTK